MMNKECCPVTSSCGTQGRKILGGIILVIAVILTILTHSGFGIFGMFLLGMVLCCHNHFRCCCQSRHACCVSEPEPVVSEVVEKASKSRSKKAAE